MFDAVLRTGFFKRNEGLRAELQGAGAASLVELPLDQPAPDSLVEDLLASPAKHVLFIDDAVKLNATHFKKLVRMAQLRADADAVCMCTAASRPLLSTLTAPSVTANVGASAVGALHIVPWCALVTKDLLTRVDFAQAQGSITALLLGLECQADVIIALGNEPAELDLESWLVDIFACEHERLAGGLAAIVPEINALHPQFRVTGRGHRVDVDLGRAVRGGLRFSVICPVFKSRFLRDTVRSVLSQTYEDIEFLIAVDGPPEEEEIAIRAILDSFADDPRLKVYCQPNMGTGPARAKLARLAAADYLVSIDDDDMFVPHTLEYFARAIEQSDSPPAALRGGIQLFGFADRYLEPRVRLLVDGIPCDSFEANQPWCLDVETLRANGGLVGDPKLRNCGEDADYFLRLDGMPELEVQLIDEPLYLRRLSAHNQTLTFTNAEFHAHLVDISSNYLPEHYRFAAHNFEDERPYVRQITRYVDLKTRREIFAATRYFNYSLSSTIHEAIIDLELTAQCNADCTFCPRENLGRTNKYLPMAIVERIAEQIEQDGIRRKIVLCGIGEPTLHPDSDAIIRMLTSAGAQVCMTNNGTRMDIARFERYAEAGLREVNFSINAATEETRQRVMKQKNFDRVKKNVRDVLELRDSKYPQIEVHVSFVLCAQNHHEVDDFVKEWRDSTANHLWIHPMNNRANLLEDDDGLYDPMAIAKRYARDPRVVVDLWDHGFAPESANMCSVAQATQFVSADGDVLLCALDHERKNILGNVMDRSLLYLQMQKLDDYRHGRFNDFCEGCTYCPRTHKSVAVHG